MVALKELRALAKDYGLPGRSKLKKSDLVEAIAKVRAAEFAKRLQRAQKTGRYSAIRGYWYLFPQFTKTNLQVKSKLHVFVEDTK